MPAILAGSVVVSRTATVPPHEKLLPPDTVAMFTVFDWPKANASLENSAAGQLWRDAAMKPFRENFLRNVQSDTFPPFDSKWDIKISNYLALAQGRVTIALTQKEGDGLSANPSAILFLMDAPDKIPQLRTNLAALKQPRPGILRADILECAAQVADECTTIGRREQLTLFRRASTENAG
ncbi:MAG: hypothetical protein DME26_04435 [Verrucomicrobia bacterium]|nr:MAG: hypothetical protein DME26_04435 [Verrucomicrobiota bacterium]